MRAGKIDLRSTLGTIINVETSDYAVVNPSNGELIELFETHTDAFIEKTIESNAICFREWKNFPFSQRSDCFIKLANILKEDKQDLSITMALEMGKPKAQGIAEVEKCAYVCEYFASNAEAFLSPYDVKTDLSLSRVTHKPLGVIFGIMPWNFPLWQVLRAAAPIIMAGNTFLLKHAPRVPRTAQGIEKMFLRAGFPAGVFKNIFASNDQCSKIISDPQIKGVCFTGSCGAGRKVATSAGHNLKSVLLELGGSDPYIVLEDADIQLAAQKTAFSRMLNNGQTCISAKRFIVLESVAEEFTECIISEFEKYKIGNPLDEGVTQGPLSREDLLKGIQDQVARSIQSGSKITYEASSIDSDGFYYPITLLSDVLPGSAAFDEELFGPVGAIVSAKSADEAVELANKTSFGLGAAIFTKDVEYGLDLAQNHINAGTCVVNDFVRSDPRLPFGGINDSGFGRELGVEGIKQFVNIKTIISN